MRVSDMGTRDQKPEPRVQTETVEFVRKFADELELVRLRLLEAGIKNSSCVFSIC